MNYIKDKQLILSEEEMRYVSIYPYDEDDAEEWREKNGLEYEYDTVTDGDYNGNLEHGWITGSCVVAYNGKYWLTNYTYSNMSGLRAASGGQTYIFSPVKKKEIITYEWVKE